MVLKLSIKKNNVRENMVLVGNLVISFRQSCTECPSVILSFTHQRTLRLKYVSSLLDGQLVEQGIPGQFSGFPIGQAGQMIKGDIGDEFVYKFADVVIQLTIVGKFRRARWMYSSIGL